MVKTIEEYLEKIGVKKDEVFSKSEAVKMMNEHLISFYRNRINLREDRNYTGYEIAEKLNFIHANFVEQFEKAVAEIEGED